MLLQLKIEEDIKMYYLDSRVENLYRIFDQNARKDYLRLDLNENPGGLMMFLKMLHRSLLHSIRKRYISLKFWRIISERIFLIFA
jgi:hypothetical protein